MTASIGPAFARVATNVAIIATADADGRHGCTGNVWAEAPSPPLLLVTLRREGETRRRIAAARRFSVSLLAADQHELARRFASRTVGDRFAGIAHHRGPAGLPLLDGALAGFECDVDAIHDFGAHDIVVGRVRASSAVEGGAPLIFGDGRFSTTGPLP